MKRIGKCWWIAGGCVVVLALYIGASAITGFETKRDDDPQPVSESVDPRSPSAVGVAAASECDALVQQEWLRRADGFGVPQGVRAWQVETADPAGGVAGSSWRTSATYVVKIKVRDRMQSWDQVFLCDVTWLDGAYSAQLVG